MKTVEELKALKVRLKTGEYNGVDIMSAWIAIDDLIDLIDFREKAFVAHPNIDLDIGNIEA